jgi:hypothetical protein
VAQEKAWQKKVLTRLGQESVRGAGHVNMRGGKKRSRMDGAMLPIGRSAQKRGKDGIASLGLGNQRRVAAVTVVAVTSPLGRPSRSLDYGTGIR